MKRPRRTRFWEHCTRILAISMLIGTSSLADVVGASDFLGDTDIDREMMQLAMEAYLWGYPLTHNMDHFENFLAGNSSRFRGVAFNRFSHAREISGPDQKFVSPNVDVLFSLAFCDLSAGPLVLSVPDTDRRYYVLQFLDPWTRNFAYVGRRSTGTEAGEYLLAPRGYRGPVPAGRKVIRAPADLFAIIGRVAIHSEDDLHNVHRVQDGFVLRSFNDQPAGMRDAYPIPQPDSRVSKDLLFWERLRVLVAAFPPPQTESDWLQQLAPLGLLDDSSPYVKPDPKLAETLRTAAKAAANKLDEDVKSFFKTVNGWASLIHLFDYNRDYFQIGAINDAKWKISDHKLAYRTRAVAARAGLWGNHGYEAAFFQVWVDADGNQLNGSKRYEWTLPKPPPAKAFWSLTMYDVPKFYLVDNPINRYGISSITEGLKFNPDGSLTIYLQRESPGPSKESNWLPTPVGDFRPLLSIYEPDTLALDPSYGLPPIHRME